MAVLHLSHMVSGAIVFLTNCETQSYSGPYEWSEMDYYTNTPPMASYPDGQRPEGTTFPIDASENPGNGVDDRVHWEGEKTCASFTDTGATFCATISSGASGKSKGTYVGSGRNSFGTQFDCYSEGHLRYLYAPQQPDATGLESDCSAVYYCSTN